jgi:hypothetical protein
MKDQLKTYDQKMCKALREHISSVEQPCGKSPANSPAGEARSGPRAVRASRSPSPAKAPEKAIQGTYGRTYFDSSASAGLPSLWANRLAERLATLGSTESALIWKVKALPSGRLKPRLVPSTRHTNGCGTGGALWATATAHERTSTPRTVDHGQQLANQMSGEFSQAHWPTPTVADVEGGRKTRSGARNDEMLLNGLLANWSTPRASDGEKGGPNMSFGAGGTPLPAQMAQTPWATPTARDWRSGEASEATMSRNARPLDEQIVHFGPTPNGSAVPMAKRGAPNPEFACWLMGWPDDLTCGALRAIQSFRSSRPKSLSRSGKRSKKIDDLFG